MPSHNHQNYLIEILLCLERLILCFRQEFPIISSQLVTVCSLFACAFLELGQCYLCPNRASPILKQLKAEYTAFYLLRVLSLHRGTPGSTFCPYFWYLILVNILTCFECKSSRYGRLNFKCLVTNYATFDTQLVHVLASRVHP